MAAIAIDAAAALSALSVADDNDTPTLSALVAPIREMPEAERPFGAAKLLECADALDAVDAMLQTRLPADVETMQDQDK